jgi:hypothetical protein
MARRTATPEGPALSVASYSRELAAFMSEWGEAYFAAYSGQREDLVLAPVYQRHAALFSRGSIDALRSVAGDSDEARQARALVAFAVEGHIEQAVVELTERVQDAEARAIVVWRGEELPYRSVPIRVAEIGDRRERNALHASYLEATDAINPLREARFAGMRAAAESLGFTDEMQLTRELHDVDVMALATELRAFLSASETIYFASLRRYLAEIDIEQGDGSTADLGHLLRGAGWDGWFGSTQMLPVMHATLAALGIDLGAMPNVTLDLERRPNKTSRAFAVPIRVPQDVRMVMQPRGGYDDYDGMLHELGHVLHFAHANPRLPSAWKYLGDNSVTEGYAFLLQYLLHEPLWLAEHLRMPDREIAGWLDFAAFRKLYMLRRYVAKLLYEIRLHTDGLAPSSRAYYAGLLGLLTGVQTAEEPYLADVDDHFYAARYLRAWMLEGSLAAAMRSAHGERWWTSADAGETLRRSWQRGQEWNAQDVVAHLGYDHLDWEPVLRQIQTQLIGEMSGYGGPNITTRAGTRKV